MCLFCDIDFIQNIAYNFLLLHIYTRILKQRLKLNILKYDLIFSNYSVKHLNIVWVLDENYVDLDII